MAACRRVSPRVRDRMEEKTGGQTSDSEKGKVLYGGNGMQC